MQTWLAEFAARGARRQLLSPRQQLALWQRVIDHSAHGAQFLDRRAIAQWASQGWNLLRQYRVEDPWMYGGGQDLQALLEWSQTWESLLAAHRWFTREDLLTELKRLEADGRLARSPRHLILLDLTELTPLEQACLDLLGRAGWRIEHRSTPSVES